MAQCVRGQEDERVVKNEETQAKLPPRQFETPKLILPRKATAEETVSQETKESFNILSRILSWMVGCVQLEESNSQAVTPVGKALLMASGWNTRGHDL